MRLTINKTILVSKPCLIAKWSSELWLGIHMLALTGYSVVIINTVCVHGDSDVGFDK